MAEFTATVFQNEFLPDGGTDKPGPDLAIHVIYELEAANESPAL